MPTDRFGYMRNMGGGDGFEYWPITRDVFSTGDKYCFNNWIELSPSELYQNFGIDHQNQMVWSKKKNKHFEVNSILIFGVCIIRFMGETDGQFESSPKTREFRMHNLIDGTTEDSDDPFALIHAASEITLAEVENDREICDEGRLAMADYLERNILEMKLQQAVLNTQRIAMEVQLDSYNRMVAEGHVFNERAELEGRFPALTDFIYEKPIESKPALDNYKVRPLHEESEEKSVQGAFTEAPYDLQTIAWAVVLVTCPLPVPHS